MKHEGRLEGREWSPRGTRIDVGWVVLIDCPAGMVGAEVLNVSAAGFRVRTARTLEVGWKVSMRVAKDAPVDGVIQWVDGRNAGGIFVESAAL
jgi:hypothetical protein